jgi:putative hydrolase of the HAD superfamily
MSSLPKAILFDLDETILSSGDRGSILIQVAEEFAESLAPLTPSEVGEAIETAFIEFWADEARHKHWRFRLFEARVLVISEVFQALRLTPEFARRFAERFNEYREPGQAKLFPGALETLDELRRRGVLLALVTNGDAFTQREKVDRFDLLRRFDHIQIEGEAGFGKPEECAYLHAMATLGVVAGETWMVGDNLEWEVAAPQRLGIYAIWHDPLGKGLPVTSPVIPDRIVRSISELVPEAN